MRRIYFLILGLLLLIPEAAQAATDLIPAPAKVGGGAIEQTGFHEEGSNNFIAQSANAVLNTVLGRFVTVFVAALSGLAVILLIIAGIQYITAGGSADKTKKARQTIINILLAIALLVGAYFLLGLIVGVLQYLAGAVT